MPLKYYEMRGPVIGVLNSLVRKVRSSNPGSTQSLTFYVTSPQLIYPTDGLVVHWSGLNLQWTLCSGIAGTTPITPVYDVYLDTVNPPVTLSGTVSGLSLATGELYNNVTYYWKVIARYTYSIGPTTFNLLGPSVVNSFNTYVTISSPQLVYPTSGLQMVHWSGVNLSWTSCAITPGSGNIVYDVYIDTNNPPTTLSGTVSGLSFLTGELSQDVTYYWRIVSRYNYTNHSIVYNLSGLGNIDNFKTNREAFPFRIMQLPALDPLSNYRWNNESGVQKMEDFMTYISSIDRRMQYFYNVAESFGYAGADYTYVSGLYRMLDKAQSLNTKLWILGTKTSKTALYNNGSQASIYTDYHNGLLNDSILTAAYSGGIYTSLASGNVYRNEWYNLGAAGWGSQYGKRELYLVTGLIANPTNVFASGTELWITPAATSDVSGIVLITPTGSRIFNITWENTVPQRKFVSLEFDAVYSGNGTPNSWKLSDFKVFGNPYNLVINSAPIASDQQISNLAWPVTIETPWGPFTSGMVCVPISGSVHYNFRIHTMLCPSMTFQFTYTYTGTEFWFKNASVPNYIKLVNWKVIDDPIRDDVDKYATVNGVSLYTAQVAMKNSAGVYTYSGLPTVSGYTHMGLSTYASARFAQQFYSLSGEVPTAYTTLSGKLYTAFDYVVPGKSYSLAGHPAFGGLWGEEDEFRSIAGYNYVNSGVNYISPGARRADLLANASIWWKTKYPSTPKYILYGDTLKGVTDTSEGGKYVNGLNPGTLSNYYYGGGRGAIEKFVSYTGIYSNLLATTIFVDWGVGNYTDSRGVTQSTVPRDSLYWYNLNRQYGLNWIYGTRIMECAATYTATRNQFENVAPYNEISVAEISGNNFLLDHPTNCNTSGIMYMGTWSAYPYDNMDTVHNTSGIISDYWKSYWEPWIIRFKNAPYKTPPAIASTVYPFDTTDVLFWLSGSGINSGLAHGATVSGWTSHITGFTMSGMPAAASPLFNYPTYISAASGVRGKPGLHFGLNTISGNTGGLHYSWDQDYYNPSGYTIMIAYVDRHIQGNSLNQYVLARRGSAADWHLFKDLTNGGIRYQHTNGPLTTSFNGAFTTTTTLSPAAVLTSGVMTVLTLLYDARQGYSQRLYRNNVLISSGTTNYATPANYSNFFSIGARITAAIKTSESLADADVYSVIYVNAPLSTTRMTEIYTYLSGVYQ